MKKVFDKLREHEGIDGEWQFKIERLQFDGMDEDDAWHKVVMEWMLIGDFKPLLALIEKNKYAYLRGPTLRLLGKLISEDRLKLKQAHGHPNDPKAAERDLIITAVYEDMKDEVGHEDLVRGISSASGKGEEVVKKAITKGRRK
jgi:hypothetical protein